MVGSPVESSRVQFCIDSPVESSRVQWNPVLCQYMVGSPVESSRVQFHIDSPVESSFVLDRFDSPVESSFVNMVQYIVKSSEVQWNPVESTGVHVDCVGGGKVLHSGGLVAERTDIFAVIQGWLVGRCRVHTWLHGACCISCWFTKWHWLLVDGPQHWIPSVGAFSWADSVGVGDLSWVLGCCSGFVGIFMGG